MPAITVTDAPEGNPEQPPVPPSLGESGRLWLKVGLLSFGGPAGQIALMQRLLVEEKQWLSNERFLHALNYCMLLPGPEAQQLATYSGWLLHGVRGGLIAGTLFVLPGALVMLVLSALYATFQQTMVLQAVFFSVKAAVLAVVIDALLKIGARTLRKPLQLWVAAASFVAIFLFATPFPLVILVAAAAGLVTQRWQQADRAAAPQPHLSAATRAAQRATFGAAAACLLLWMLPLLVLAIWLGPAHVYAQESLFFSKMAVVTFGGAYAVLAYMAQQAVEHYGWLEPGEMLDGLGLAETTPGPLILVAQFVGFMAAYRNPGALDPLLAGTLGALLTTWVTFVPCFLWIFVGAPYIESLRHNPSLAAALASITAAVVGVMLNLALWFALTVLFSEIGEWSA
ncbi:MAG: chromate efflux transporter, partial [Gammaproteobacteria bacterium]|nr:chromate efflux transporter [Gammaproteobacteria bacterium]